MRKTCVFIIGTNASGKSTVARKLIESFGGIESYSNGISSTKDGVAFAGRYDVKYGGVDNLNGTTILRDIVKKALESTDCIICEGMRLKCWGPNLTHAMFNADRQIVIFLYAPLEEIQKRLAERSNGTLNKDIIRGQRESAHSAKKWQTAGCDVVAIDTTKQTADQIADFIINKINS